MLNLRQRTLLYFLQKNSDTYVTQYAISQNLPLFYFYDGDQKDFHDTKVRQRIMYDIRQINADPETPAVIVTNNRGVKIANEDESRAGMRSEYAAIFRKLKRAYAKERKIARDGQLIFAPNGDMTVYRVYDALSEEEGNGEAEEIRV